MTMRSRKLRAHSRRHSRARSSGTPRPHPHDPREPPRRLGRGATHLVTMWAQTSPKASLGSD
eukprot:8226501-Pyramimonas_sp.AAC.1